MNIHARVKYYIKKLQFYFDSKNAIDSNIVVSD